MSSRAPTPVLRPPPAMLARRVGRRVQDWIPAALVFCLGIAAWEGGVRGLDVQQFLLPPLSEILQRIADDRDTIWNAALYTFQEAVIGFAVGSALAMVAALALARWKRVGQALMPYMIAANAIPIIAFAPITNNWFGVLGKTSKIVIAAVLVFFPVLVNTLRGLTTVQPQSIELMRSYAAGELEIYRRVRIPNALPYIFSALKVASVLAMIGAIVGDYFGGSDRALGILIRRSVGVFDFTEAWAAIVLASVLGMAFYAAIAAVERLTMGWHPSARGAQAE